MENDIVEVNGTYLDLLISGLKERELNLENNVVQIYKRLGELQQGWSGESYDKFIEIMETYRDPLNSAALTVGAFAEMLEKTFVPAADEFIAACETALRGVSSGGHGISRPGGMGPQVDMIM